MNREQFFQELRTALHREGFTPQTEQDELLPVEWDGLPLCRITADGGVRYWQEDVATPERERACERATDLACTVREYMTLLEQAPPLQAQSLTGDYRLLADFNGVVLAAHPTRLGVQFVTWDWSFDRTGLNQGNYFQENYAGAKQDFAIRAGLISKQQIFNQEQLTLPCLPLWIRQWPPECLRWNCTASWALWSVTDQKRVLQSQLPST